VAFSSLSKVFIWLFKKEFHQPLFSTGVVENERSEKHPQWKLIYIGIGTVYISL